MTDNTLEASIVKALSERGQTIGTAESCTGGLIAHRLTNIPGSSACVWGGIVAYANEVKEHAAGVSDETLKRFGAVSAQTAAELARGARQLLAVDVAVSVTGIAGPGGGSAEKPVGLTYIGIATKGFEDVKRYVWKGDRLQNKEQSADAALRLVLDYLAAHPVGTKDVPNEAASAVDADILPDGRIAPKSFTWQGERHQVTALGRQWLKGNIRCVLVRTDRGDTIELSVAMPSMRWTATAIGDRLKLV